MKVLVIDDESSKLKSIMKVINSTFPPAKLG